jgi:hypothetical protein
MKKVDPVIFKYHHDYAKLVLTSELDLLCLSPLPDHGHVVLVVLDVLPHVDGAAEEHLVVVV